jgi:hypothetical protein
MAKKIRGLLLLVMVFAIGASLPALAQRREAIKQPRPSQARDKLHELATKAGGHFVMRYRLDRATLYPNVEELAKRSDVVIVGRTLSRRTKLREDGNFINQEFLVRVQEVIKGNLPNGQSITVSMPGGSYTFPDKTIVIVEPVGRQQVENQATYVFFLKSVKAEKSGADVQQHRLTSETQGMFALTDGRVKPSALSKDDPVVVKYQQMSASDFLREVHKAVPRKEHKAEASGK